MALAGIVGLLALSGPAYGQIIFNLATSRATSQPAAATLPVLPNAATQPGLSPYSRFVAMARAQRDASTGTQPSPHATTRPVAAIPATQLEEDDPRNYWDFVTVEVPVVTRPAPSQPAATRPVVADVAKPVEKTQPWADGLKEAITLAQQNNRPVLVRVGAPWCVWCRKLETEIGRPGVQKELARWTLVYIDTDRNSDEAQSLGIGPIPAMRVLTPTGRVVASQDGYMAADALIAWLGKQHDQASIAAPQELRDDTPPDAALLARLLKQFDNRDPVLREATIRRLSPHPDVAAVAVVNAFSGGKLAVRLTALELLEAWNAPVRELDPWQPETINEARLKDLKAWAGRPGKTPATRPENLDEHRLASARDELAAYLKAQTPAEVQAIRERLARYGLALLPEVLDLLKAADDDAARERLGALRYRLAASDALALSWPGGFERLASLSAATSQQAVEELTAKATGDDVPLLLELFGHPDPLVRETTLRALQAIGGTQTTDALVKLLHDPEPNVRAAVLKQLAEKPNRQLVPKIAEYVKTETDADLIVHAVRFLREAKGTAAVECLVTMLSHESWRVRAEAAEAIGQCANDTNSLSQEKRADVYVALIKLLDDPDGFVVSRAVQGLSGSDLSAAVEPLSRAAVKHPELADEISQMMAQTRGQRNTGAAQLRGFLKNGDPRLRAGAITSLAAADPQNIGSELLLTLQDRESTVRIAAAVALMQVLEQYRSGQEAERPGMVVETRRGVLGGLFGNRSVRVATTHPDASQPASQPSGQPKEPELDPQSRWLLKFRAGQGRPAWMDALIPPLEVMLAADAVEERMAATLPLIALGADGQALPLLMVEATNTPAIQPKAIAALPWLPWEKRLELFALLLQLDSTPERLNELASSLAKVPDLRAADPLWDILARPEFDENGATAIHQALMTLYFGERQHEPAMIPPSKRAAATAAARQRIEEGTSLQRVVGLAILLISAREEAGKQAQALMKAPATAGDPQLRRDAGQVWLLADASGGRTAVEALSSDSPELRQMALLYLAFGRSRLQMLRNRIPVAMSFREQEEYLALSTRAPIEPKAPEGLNVQMVRPFLQDPDAKTAACAGYLLALLGEADGLPPLIAYWRGSAKNDQAVARLVYRAIAALGDDAQVPVLDEIYRQFGSEDHRIREFYWTIRIMKGPECLKLREKIRREVGTEKLR